MTNKMDECPDDYFRNKPLDIVVTVLASLKYAHYQTFPLVPGSKLRHGAQHALLRHGDM
jgi:hypothetical protein